MLVQPSAAEFERVMKKVDESASNDYDMEVINYLYEDNAMILPHRPYDLLTQEFTYEKEKHKWYLGSDSEKFDPVAVYNEAKFLHFSDWPVPKPWIHTPEGLHAERQPKCLVEDGWKTARRGICGTTSIPSSSSGER